jgi:hypothetical protein
MDAYHQAIGPDAAATLVLTTHLGSAGDAGTEGEVDLFGYKQTGIVVHLEEQLLRAAGDVTVELPFEEAGAHGSPGPLRLPQRGREKGPS